MRKSVQILLHLEKEFANLGFTQADAGKIEKYLNYLMKWNQKINLTGYKDIQDMFGKIVLDSLMIHKIPDTDLSIKQRLSGRVMDLGSGAGVPGLVLALYDSSLNIDSVDGSQKKITFQKMVQANLGLANVHPLNMRIEDLMLIQSYKESYDCILSRALAQINSLFSYSDFFLRSGGDLFLWKGANWKDELTEGTLTDLFKLMNELPYYIDEFNHRGVLVHFRKM